jgi:DnaJ-class molecular chaperone
MKFKEINPNLKLEKGERVCSECNGWGYLKTANQLLDYKSCSYKICPKCLGKCTLDFVDAATGRNNDSRWK